MGTSTSYRSPPTPRWNAVLASYRANLGVARTTSELFNAATVEGWLDHFQDGPLLHYARAVETLYYALPDRLQEAKTGARSLHSIVDATRSEALAEFGGDLSLAIGDRAFARVLMRQVQEGGLQAASVGDVSDSWIRNRPSEPGSLVRQFLSEVLREFVLHVTIRDLPSLVGQVFDNPSEARSLSRELAEEAAALVTNEDFIDRMAAAGPTFSAWMVWPEVMDEAFRRGRALLGNDFA